MITTVLLDLDDTILDFHKAEKEALKKALQKVGVEPTEKLLARYSEINQAQWKKLELGELTQEEVKISRYRIFFEEYGITASPEETAKCYEQNLAYEHEKVDGALELLQKLHGKYRLYAASNGTYEVQRRRIEESGIKPYFEDFFISRFIFCITIIYVNRNLCHINDSISVYDRLNGDTTENKRRNYHLISLPPLKSNLSESESFVAKSNNVSRRIL